MGARHQHHRGRPATTRIKVYSVQQYTHHITCGPQQQCLLGMMLLGEVYAECATLSVRARAVSIPGVYGSSLKLHCTQHSSHCVCNELGAGSLPVMLLTAHLNHFAPFPLKKLHLHRMTQHPDYVQMQTSCMRLNLDTLQTALQPEHAVCST